VVFHNVLIVDDDEIARATLGRAMREYGAREVATAPTLSAGRDRLERTTDLLITAAVIAGEACFPLLDRVRAHCADSHVVALDRRTPGRLLFRLGQRCEVSALLEKPIERRVLFRCLDSLDSVRHRAATRSSIDTAAAALEPEALESFLETLRAPFRLTRAEVEVLRCGVAQMGRADIALQRGVSTNTLKTQVRSLLAKTGAPSLESLASRVRRDAKRTARQRAQAG
jgi:DNA-binding NarL/FixJ family response regulator